MALHNCVTNTSKILILKMRQLRQRDSTMGLGNSAAKKAPMLEEDAWPEPELVGDTLLCSLIRAPYTDCEAVGGDRPD